MLGFILQPLKHNRGSLLIFNNELSFITKETCDQKWDGLLIDIVSWYS